MGEGWQERTESLFEVRKPAPIGHRPLGVNNSGQIGGEGGAGGNRGEAGGLVVFIFWNICLF